MLDADGKIVNSDVEKIEMIHGYFCSVSGMKQESVSISCDVDGIESLPSVIMEDVRQ